MYMTPFVRVPRARDTKKNSVLDLQGGKIEGKTAENARHHCVSRGDFNRP